MPMCSVQSLEQIKSTPVLIEKDNYTQSYIKHKQVLDIETAEQWQRSSRAGGPVTILI